MNIEKINELFKCKYCFEIYKQPVILSCGHKICSKDLEKIKIDTKMQHQEVVMCHVMSCQEIMIIPPNGFLIDKDFSIFTDMTGFNGIDFGDKYKRSKRSIEEFKKQIDELKYLIKNPDDFITDYFSHVHKVIDIEREELIFAIDQHYVQLKDELHQIESICKLSKPLEVLKPFDNLAKITKEIDVFESNLLKLTNDIENMKVNEESWDKITFESNYQKLKLKQITECYTSNLLTNKSYSFQPNALKVKEVVENAKFATDQYLKNDWSDNGFIQFKLPDFKNFIAKKDSSYQTDTFVFKGFKWYFKMRNLDSVNLCWTLHCELENTNKLVYCTNRFEVVNINEPSLNHSRRLKMQFKNDKKGHGIREFLSFQDIFKKGYYDDQDDSIHVNVFIQLDDIQEN